MAQEKLIAREGNRTYSFYLLNRTATQISIEMYNTAYSLTLQDGVWRNQSANKMEMAPLLISAVVAAITTTSNL